MDRAEQKRLIFAAFDTAGGEKALHELVSNQEAPDYRYQRFAISGRYDGEHQFLLDNMVHDGRAGYEVLTPLRVGGKAVLINRGWVPGDPDRSVLPAISIGDDYREVTGRLNSLPRPGLRLEPRNVSDNTSWPRRLSFPTAAELVDQIGYVVYDYQLLLDQDGQDGFVREWKPALMGPERHLGYAIQWFTLAFTLVVIYFIVNWKTRDRTEEND